MEPRSRATNVILLTLSYAASQGALLLAQSLLLANGNLRLVGQFGVCFTFAVLVQYMLDWGGTIVLARRTASEPTSAHIYYRLLTTFRILLGCVCGAAAIFWLLTTSSDGFTYGYVMGALPALLLSPLNAAGLLDGRGISGMSGVASSFPAAFSALGLVLVLSLDPIGQGVSLGAIFSLAVACSLGLQLRSLRTSVRALLPSLRDMRDSRPIISEASFAIATLVPSYFSFRAQVGLASHFLGVEVTGLFIYAKQIVNAAAQLVQQVRRVEFPSLVTRSKIREPIFAGQRQSLALALSLGIVLSIIGYVAAVRGPSGLRAAGEIVAVFAPLLFVSAIFAALYQRALALGQSRRAAGSAAAAFVASTLLATVLLPRIGLYALAWAELFGLVIGLMLVGRRR